MPYPSSVERVILTGPKQGQQKVRPKFLPGSDVALDPDEPDTGVGVGGPILDFGKDGSVTLDRSKGLWGWKWIKGDSVDDRTLRTGRGVLLYPATRSVEAGSSDVKAAQVAEAAVDYVRALPDVSEFTSISDIIVEELTKVAKLPELDVYEGDILAVMNNSSARMAKVCLAFPTGEVGSHLNVSPFLPATGSTKDRHELASFRADSKPVDRFSTAILQICSSPILSGHKNDRDCTALMVRVQTSTHMLNVNPHRIAVGDAETVAETTRIGELTMDQTEGRRHVDMALDETSWSKALLVDEGGGVWLWQEEKVEVRQRVTKVMQLRKLRGAVHQDRHGFFRIAFGSRPGTALVMSDKNLTVIDFEGSASTETILLELTGQGRVFAALEKSALTRRANFTCVATNFEVMWVDELRVGPPVLTWNHDVGGGAHKDLALSTFSIGQSDYTLLTCRSSDMTLVFEVDSQPPARSLRHPFVLELLPKELAKCRVRTTTPLRIGHVRQDDREASHLAVLGLDGSLRSLTLSVTPQYTDMDLDASPSSRDSGPRPLWDTDIQMKATGPAYMDEDDRDWQDKAAAKNKLIDLRWAWQAINEPETDHGEHFTAEIFEQHLRELEAPFDSLATLYVGVGDLARDAISDQTAGQRSHALLPLPVDNSSIEGDLAALSSLDPSKYSLAPIVNLGEVEPQGGHPTPFAVPRALETLDTTFQAGRDVDPIERDRIKRDTRRLVMDLMLSRTIVHSEELYPNLPVLSASARSSVETPEDLFERTQQLTLNENAGSAKEIDMRFLKPKGHPSDNFDDDLDPRATGDVGHALQIPSARTLLGEWDLSADPGDYTWSAWRDAPSRVSTPIQRPVRPLPSPRSTQRFPQSQPTLGRQLPGHSLAAASNAGFPAVIPLQQSMRSSPPPVLQSSQAYPDFGASTQIERGPFGGRLESKKKKKPAKKRVGGF